MPMDLSIFNTYRIILQRNSDGALFPGFVVKSEDGSIIVRTHDSPIVQLGETLEGSIVIHHKKAMFNGTVTQVCDQEIGLLVSGKIEIIDTPESARRAFEAFHVAKANNSKFRVEVVDIAPEGVGLKSTYNFDPGTNLILELQQGATTFDMPFEVRYCQAIEGSGFFKVGCKAVTSDQVLSLKYLMFVQADDPVREIFNKKAA